MSTEYTSEDEAKRDRLCKPMTLAEVMKRTGRSQRTIERWIADGHLTKYEVEHPREIMFLERDVVQTESKKFKAKYQGRPRPAGTK